MRLASFPVNPGFIVVVVLAVLLMLSWNVRRHGESGRPQRHWRRTDEVFRDPSTNRLMRVWEDPADGSRHYVPEEGPGESDPARGPGAGRE